MLVNPADIEELGLADRQLVDLVSTWEHGIQWRTRDFRVVAYPSTRGSAASYYPETNVLVPLDSVTEMTNTPTPKGVLVAFQPANNKPRRRAAGRARIIPDYSATSSIAGHPRPVASSFDEAPRLISRCQAP